MSEAILEASARQIAAAVRGGEYQARDVAEAFLGRAQAGNGALGALLHLSPERVRERAAALDARRDRGEPLGPLAGVPVLLKDNLCERGEPLTCGSRILEGYRPPYNAHVVERLLEADALPLGRANMDEFAMGSSSEHSAYATVHNPWDLTRTPGGSSGGSAAALAAGFAPLALGSDTGGSVRQPGAFCGVHALKPSYGRVSRYGLVAFASSLDQVGPMARDAGDVALLLEVIAGHDPRDATSVEREKGAYLAACQGSLQGLRLGVVKDLDQSGNDPAVTASFEAAVAELRALGMQPVEIELPHLSYAVATYYLVATAEASSNLARFDGMRYGLRVTGADLAETYSATRGKGFGPEVQRRILLGTYALSAGYYDAYYLKAQKVRTLIMRDFSRAFEACDVLVTPTAPTPAFALGEKLDDPLAMYLADIYTLPASLAGVPAMSVPAGFTQGPSPLPLGLQVMAPHFEEERLLRVAAAYGAATEHHLRRPPLSYHGQ